MAMYGMGKIDAEGANAPLKTELMRVLFRLRSMPFRHMGARRGIWARGRGFGCAGGEMGPFGRGHGEHGGPFDMFAHESDETKGGPFPPPPGPPGHHGISFMTLAFMMRLHESEVSGDGRAPSPSELGDFLHVSKAAVSQMMGLLERKGMVTRETDPSNRRKVIVRLTQKGRDMVDAAHMRFDTWVDSVIEAFGERDMLEFIRLIDKLADTIESIEKSGEGIDGGESACGAHGHEATGKATNMDNIGEMDNREEPAE